MADDENPDLMKVADSVGSFLEIATGYLNKAKQNGFSDEAAEELALSMHQYCLSVSLNQR